MRPFWDTFFLIVVLGTCPFCSGSVEDFDVSKRPLPPHPAEYFDVDRRSLRSGYKIEHPDLCPSNGTLRLLIAVHSAAEHFQSRVTIRQTWGSVSRRADVVLAFFLGLPRESAHQSRIETEDDLYGDVVQGDFLDAYHNLTLKSISMVRWVRDLCPCATFVLKIDDDCFLNPDALLRHLDVLESDVDAVVYGRLYEEVHPFRDPSSKWYVSKRQYRYRTLPTFAVGTSYLLTRIAVLSLCRAIPDTRPIVLEDAYLTGLCAEAAGVVRIHDDRFGVEQRPNICAARRTFTYHQTTRNRMALLWWLIHDTRGDLCDEEPSDTTPLRRFNILLAHDG